MSITTLANIKAICLIPSSNTSLDAFLTLIHTRVEAMVEKWCDRTFARTVYAGATAEYKAGTGTPDIVMKQRPIVSVENIWEDDSGYYGSPGTSFPDSTLLVEGTDYAFQPNCDTGIITRIDDVWTRPLVRKWGMLTPWHGRSKGNIKVEYTAGYTDETMPSDLKMAVEGIVSKLKQMLPQGKHLTSESYEVRSVSYLILQHKNQLLAEFSPILAQYRNKYFGDPG